MVSGIRILLPLFLLGLAAELDVAHGQDLRPFENEVPFGLRMAFFRGVADKTRCVLTFAVDNQNLLFFRRTDHFESRYEAFISMRDTESQNMIRGLWQKQMGCR